MQNGNGSFHSIEYESNIFKFDNLKKFGQFRLPEFYKLYILINI